MKPTTKYVYVAFGFGEFPDDMLRYDRAERIGADVPYKCLPKNVPFDEDWSFHILISDREPTVARWNSFSWGVRIL